MRKKEKKRADRTCHFCGESNYSLLDVHRIVPGSQGGKYQKNNTVTCCCRCHRLIHSNEIVIDRWYNSSTGRLLHFFIRGEEKFC